MVDSVIAREQEHLHNAGLKGVLIAEEVDILFVPVKALHAAICSFYLLEQVLSAAFYLEECIKIFIHASMHLNLTREGRIIAIPFDTSK